MVGSQDAVIYLTVFGGIRMQSQYVWDLPIRIFHWLLAASIPAAIVTGMIGGDLIEWHGRLGLFILGLIIFRLIWGVVGSRTARFVNFVRGPRAILDYLRGEWRGIGHNPLGALSVLGLLAIISAQIGTGLFANDDITFQGPLAYLIESESSNHMRSLHALLKYGLIAMVSLHVVAIIFYVRFKRENLVRPMLTGRKEIDPNLVSPEITQGNLRLVRVGRSAISFIVSAAISLTVVYVVASGLAPSVTQSLSIKAPFW